MTTNETSDRSADEPPDMTRDKVMEGAVGAVGQRAIRATVEAELSGVAADVDPVAGDPGANLFDEFDIDSIDFLRLITRLSERYGVPMPECDYSRMQSVDALVSYLAGAVDGRRDPAP